jgi:hypothetical protein
MKPSTYILLIGLFFLGFSCNKDRIGANYLKSSDYRIKREVHYSPNSNEEVNTVEYSYNKNGLLMEEIYYSNPKNLPWKSVKYEYSNGKRIGQKIYSSGNTLALYLVFHYNGNQLIKEESFRGYDNSLIYSVNYEYDNRNNLIRQYGGDISSSTRYEYNDKNMRVLEENSAFNIADYKYIKYIFDEDEREVKLEYYNSEWQLLSYLQKIYSDNSKSPSEEIRFDKNGISIEKYTHYYDQWNNRIKTIDNQGCTRFNNSYSGELLIESVSHDVVWGCAERGKIKYEYEKK